MKRLDSIKYFYSRIKSDLSEYNKFQNNIKDELSKLDSLKEKYKKEYGEIIQSINNLYKSNKLSIEDEDKCQEEVEELNTVI